MDSLHIVFGVSDADHLLLQQHPANELDVRELISRSLSGNIFDGIIDLLADVMIAKTHTKLGKGRSTISL